MPIDPNIYFNRIAPAPGAQHYANEYLAGQGQGIQNAIHQAQLGQMQQEMANEAQMRRMAQESGGDPRAYLAKLYQVNPGAALQMEQKMRQDEAQTQQMGFAASKEQRAAAKAQLDNHLSVMGLVGQNIASLKSIPLEQRQPVYQQMVPRLQEIATSANVRLPEFPQMVPNDAELDQAALSTMDALKQFEEMRKRLEGVEPKSDIGKYNQDVKKGLITPEQAQAGIRKVTHIAPGMTVQVGNGTPSPTPSQRSSRALQIANGEIPIVKPTRGDTRAERDMADAREIMLERGEDPVMLPGKYESTRKGQISFAAGQPNAKIITAMNTASDHIDKILKPAAQALNNGDWRSANRLMNAVGVQIGKDEKTNFDAVATFLATEVAKVASGGGAPTISEIAEARRMFPAEGSNKQIFGAINIANQIMGGKLSALDIEHKNAFGGKSILEANRLSPEAVKNLATHDGNEPKKWGAKPPSGNPDTTTLGKNPRFRNAVWVGKGASDGPGWYVREGSNARRVE